MTGLVIDLTGPEGNALSLIAQAEKLAYQLDLDAPAIREDMMADTYDHLLDVFETYFGEYVTLEGRPR